MNAIGDVVSEKQSWSEIDQDLFARDDGLAAKLARDEKKDATHQLRKMFGVIKRVQRQYGPEKTGLTDPLPQNMSSELLELLPQAAYDKGRNLISEPLYRLIKETFAPGKIATWADFDRFVSFMTATIAYHRFFNPTK